MIGKNIAWPLTILVAVVIPFMVGCASRVAPVENIPALKWLLWRLRKVMRQSMLRWLKVAADKLNRQKQQWSREFDGPAFADEAIVMRSLVMLLTVCKSQKSSTGMGTTLRHCDTRLNGRKTEIGDKGGRGYER
jgi:hypothetical protein